MGRERAKVNFELIELRRGGMVARLFIEEPDFRTLPGIVQVRHDPRTGDVVLYEHFQGLDEARFGGGFWEAWEIIVDVFIQSNF